MPIRKYSLEQLQIISGSKQGSLVSKTYNSRCMSFTCSRGHTFKQKPCNVMKGKWCPICSGYKNDISLLQVFAKKNNGILMSKKYINNRSNLIWRCNRGHIFETSYNNLLTRVNNKKNWCTHCEQQLKISDRFEYNKEREINSAYPKIWPTNIYWKVNENII